MRWRHYEVLFDEEKKLPGNVRQCPKLTAAHVRPNTFARMRVKLMTQVIVMFLLTYHQYFKLFVFVTKCCYVCAVLIDFQQVRISRAEYIP